MPAACQSRAVTEPQRDSWHGASVTDELETDRRKSALHFIAERSEAIAITDAETDCFLRDDRPRSRDRAVERGEKCHKQREREIQKPQVLAHLW